MIMKKKFKTMTLEQIRSIFYLDGSCSLDIAGNIYEDSIPTIIDNCSNIIKSFVDEHNIEFDQIISVTMNATLMKPI